MATDRRPGPRRVRRWRMAAGVALGVCLVVVVVHLPPVRSKVLSWGVSRLEASGLQVEASRLSYNLFTLTAALEDVRVSATGHDVPFFEAASVEVDAPWAIVRGGRRLESLEVEAARVTIVRRADGRLNLPAGAEAASGPALEPAAPPWELGRLLVTGLDVRFEDSAIPLEAIARGIGMDFAAHGEQPLAGRLSMSEAATLRIGEREAVVRSIDGGLSFDGRRLSATALEVESSAGRVRIAGSADLLGDAGSFELRFDAELEASALAGWAGVPDLPEGRVDLSGTAGGTFDAPVVAVDVLGRDLSWPGVGPFQLEARALVSTETAAIESFRLGIADGEANGSGSVSFDAEGASSARVRFAGIDARRLPGASSSGVQVASSLAGVLAIDWSGTDILGARADLSVSLSPAERARDAWRLSGALDLHLRDRRWTLTAKALETGVFVVEGTAAGRLADDLAATTFDGRAVVSVTDVRAAVEQLASAETLAAIAGGAPLGGAATIRADIGGTFRAPRARGRVDAEALEWRGLGPAAADGTFDASLQAVQFRDFRLTLGPHAVTADVTIGLEDRSLAGAVTAGIADLSSFAPVLPDDWPVKGAASVVARLGGTFDAPDVTATVEFSTLGWNDYALGAVQARVTLSAGVVEVGADVPSVGGSANATLPLGGESFTAALTIAGAELSALLHASGPAGAPDVLPGSGLTGRLRLTATAEGNIDALAQLTATIDAELTGAAVAGVPVSLDRPVRLRLIDGRLSTDDLELRVGQTTMAARGRLGATAAPDDEITVEVRGTLADLMPFIRMLPDSGGIDVDGRLELTARARGAIDAPDVSARLTIDGATVQTAGLPPVTGLALDAALSDGRLDVTRLLASWQGAELSGTAVLPAAMLSDYLPAAYLSSFPPDAGPARASLRVSSITPAALEPFVDRATLERITGRVDLVVEAEAPALDAARVSADVTMTRADVELARVPLAQATLTRLRLTDRRLEIVEWNWVGGGHRVSLSGAMDFSGDDARLDLAAGGSLDLRMIGVFAPDLATAGRATFDVRASGLAAEPDVRGRVALEGAELVIRDPRIAVTELRGVMTLAPDAIRLEDWTASANGGTLALSGTLGYSGLALESGKLVLSGRGLSFEAIDGLRTEVDTDLTLTVAAAPSLSGQVTIQRGNYRRPLRLTEQLFGTRVATSPAAGPTESGFLSDLQLNVTIVSAQDVVIQNNYGELHIGSNLRVTGTAARPALGGRLSLREGGEVFLGGQTYTVRRGTVDFTSATRIEPVFDLALETGVQRYDITLSVSGPLDGLEVGLRGPGVSQEDAISLLLAGRTADEESPMANADIARGQLIMLLSGELLGLAGSAVGLDSVQVGRGLGGAASTFDLLATDSDLGARLTLTKQLRRDVELVFSQSLRDSGDITWIATYRPFRHIDLRATTDDDRSESYEFRHELLFGGGAPAAPTGRPGAAAPRVTIVEVQGADGIRDSGLQGRLRLTPGRRFDYYEWERDREQILGRLRDLGFLEARLTARRRNSGWNAVALDYVITAGPRTTLLVEGFPLPAPVVERMKAAWAQAVFDGFLVEDLTDVARRELVAERYVQAEVRVEIDAPESGGEKTILVRIDPGPRFAERRIAFIGNRQMPASALEEVVRSRALAVEAWIDPGALAAAVTGFYESRGYLAAVVEPLGPTFEGSTATLPVSVDEGPAYRVGRVEVTGAATRPPDELRSVLALPADGLYRPEQVDPARRRLEVDYLDRGYNSVRVAARVVAQHDRHEVSVTFEVTEGPQQVLAGIDVQGAETTARSTIDRALALEVGEPADRSDTYAAQKRLYDTGVFQFVDVSFEPAGGQAPEGVEPVRAVVRLEELPRYRFRYGFRITDRTGPSEGGRAVEPALVADLLDRNLFGRAITAGAAGQIEADRRLVRGILSLPTLFGRRLVTSLYLTQSRDEIVVEGQTAFVQDATELTLEQRFRPSRTMNVTYGYGFSREHLFEPDPDPDAFLPPLDVRANVARLTGTYAWDTRDDPANATRGWFHSSGLEYGDTSLGSDLRFIRYLGQQYYFHRVGGVVLASAFRLGAGRGFDQDLIASEKFFAGGGSSVRGFAEGGLGGRDFLGDPTGGNALILLNQEVRVPIYKWVRGVGFLDAGNVFDRAGDLSFRDLEVGTGVGMRVDSPFAVFRVDFGVPLTSRGLNPRGRWYFAIGHTF